MLRRSAQMPSFIPCCAWEKCRQEIPRDSGSDAERYYVIWHIPGKDIKAGVYPMSRKQLAKLINSGAQIPGYVSPGGKIARCCSKECADKLLAAGPSKKP